MVASEMLGKYYSLDELACRDCGKCVIDPKLVDALDELRVRAGVQIKVLSAYRCPEHNTAVGGKSDSQHILGKAADIEILGRSVADMYNLAITIDAFANGGIGVYDGGFLHVDVRDKPARWSRINGVYGPLQSLVHANSRADSTS